MTTLEIILSVIGGSITIISAILGGVWAMLRYTHQTGVSSGQNESRLKLLEKKTEKANCLQNTRNLIEIKRWLIKFDSNMIDNLAEKASPRKLTPMGTEILKLSGANDIMSKIGDDLIAQLETIVLPTAFDVETEAYFILLQNENNECYNRLKNFIYNSPKKIEITVAGIPHELELDYDAILRATSLNLRDRYLSLHPEIE